MTSSLPNIDVTKLHGETIVFYNLLYVLWEYDNAFCVSEIIPNILIHKSLLAACRNLIFRNQGRDCDVMRTSYCCSNR